MNMYPSIGINGYFRNRLIRGASHLEGLCKRYVTDSPASPCSFHVPVISNDFREKPGETQPIPAGRGPHSQLSCCITLYNYYLIVYDPFLDVVIMVTWL